MSSSAPENPGCVLLLLDESIAMESEVQDERASLATTAKSKSTAVASAINAFIRQLTAGPDFEIALVGYHADAQGNAIAESRWGGALAGRDFVPLSEIASSPITVEKRPRKLADPSSLTGFREELFDFPIWYEPKAAGSAPQVTAFQRCVQLLTDWNAANPNAKGAPLLLHVFAGGSSDGNSAKAIEEFKKLPGSPLVFQAHLCTSGNVPATLYAANRLYVAAGPVRDVFDRSSPLPTELARYLKLQKVAVGPNARGMACNARMMDLVQFLSLAKEHTKGWPSRKSSGVAEPQAEPTTTSIEPPKADEPAEPVAVENVDTPLPVESLPRMTEQAALVVFVLDRSVDDPFSGNLNNAWSRLQEHANGLLGKLAKGATGKIDVGVVSYGLDAVGDIEIRNSFDGPLAGQTLVSDAELSTAALREDEIQQQEPDGVGGLMTITIKKKIFMELDPTNAAKAGSAFESVQNIIHGWCEKHPDACVPPVVIHLTRGQHEAASIESDVAPLRSINTAAGPIALYHLVATEAPQSSVSYPADDSGIETPELKKLCHISSRLLAVDKLAASKPKLVSPDSRGIVINAKFDLLIESLSEALA